MSEAAQSNNFATPSQPEDRPTLLGVAPNANKDTAEVATPSQHSAQINAGSDATVTSMADYLEHKIKTASKPMAPANPIAKIEADAAKIAQLHATRYDEKAYEALLKDNFSTPHKLQAFQALLDRYLANGTAVKVDTDESENPERYKITGYSLAGTADANSQTTSPDIFVYLESLNKKDHLAISLREILQWNGMSF